MPSNTKTTLKTKKEDQIALIDKWKPFILILAVMIAFISVKFGWIK